MSLRTYEHTGTKTYAADTARRQLIITTEAGCSVSFGQGVVAAHAIAAGEQLVIDSGASSTVTLGGACVVSTDGSFEEYVAPTAPEVITSATATIDAAALTVGDTALISVTSVTPSTITDFNTAFVSKDKTVAMVDADGVVKAVGEGQALFEVWVDNVKVEVTATVTINPAP